MIRRMTTLLMSLALGAMLISAKAIGLGDIRNNARFLTDRMVYELGLSPMQAEAVFEINYDFLTHVNPYLYDLAYNDPYAFETYYNYLNERNDDLRWVLSDSEYRRFMALNHYFRPIQVSNRSCLLSVYNIYTDRDYFYYDRPSVYYSYSGGHSRRHYNNSGYYYRHYSHRPSTVFVGEFRIGNVGISATVRKSDNDRYYRREYNDVYNRNYNNRNYNRDYNRHYDNNNHQRTYDNRNNYGQYRRYERSSVEYNRNDRRNYNTAQRRDYNQDYNRHNYTQRQAYGMSRSADHIQRESRSTAGQHNEQNSERGGGARRR